MKKFISKIITVIMAMTMVLAMGVPVLAADGENTSTAKNVTLTINGQKGAEYTVYQVMSAKEISTGLYTYELSSDFKNAFPMTVNSKKYVLNANNEICIETTTDEEGTQKTVQTPVTTDSLTYDKTTYNSNSDVAQLAAALEGYAKTVATKLTIIENTASAELPIGYYLVEQTKVPASTDGKNGYVASKPVLVNLTEDKTVTAKDDTEKLDKTITGLNDDTSKDIDENTAKIGDVINYKVTTYIPTYGADVDKTSLKFWLYDTFSKGITYNNDVKVYISDTQDTLGTQLASDAYTTDKSASQDVTFEINLKPETIVANQGKYVTLEYSGTLNEDAVVNSKDGNPNTIELNYTNSAGNGEDHLSDNVKTYTFGLGVKKVDKATQEELDGAVFTLTKKGEKEPIKLVKVSADEYRVATDKDENTVTDIEVNSKSGHNPVIKGLDEGEYILHEKQAPDKYSTVPDITVTIRADQKDGKYTGKATISVDSGKLQDGNKSADNTNKVTADNGTVNINVYVEDTKGISLPETGSKTAMYCLFGGALLVIMGGVFFGLTGRKRSR